MLIVREVKDPRVAAAGLLTITRVRLSKDGHRADVLVSFLSDSARVVDGALGALVKMAGYLRGEVARRLGVNRAPEITFVHDTSAELVARIENLARGGSE